MLSLEFALGSKVPERQTKTVFSFPQSEMPGRRVAFLSLFCLFIFYLIFRPGNHIDDMTHLQDLYGLTISLTFQVFVCLFVCFYSAEGGGGGRRIKERKNLFQLFEGKTQFLHF